MNRTKRKKPLLSIEQICEMNGVKYDTSRPSDYVEIINDDGESLIIDSSFNLFSDVHKKAPIQKDKCLVLSD